MRYFAFIWSFLVIALSFTPCCDEVDMAPVYGNTVLLQGGTHGHQHAADDCSPFCRCSCCGGFSFYFQSVEMGAIGLLPRSNDYALYRIPTPRSLPLPIWQPPQLV